MFSEYVNTFLKLKQESSGWPSNCVPSNDQSLDSPEIEEARRTYVDSYFEHEGVHLNPDDIKVNKGLRAFSKYCLNSFYGKFGQRSNLTQTEYITDPPTRVKVAFLCDINSAGLA